jgi:two-component system OmpR family response regulator
MPVKPKKRIQILLVEPDAHAVEPILARCDQREWEVTLLQSGADALAYALLQTFDMGLFCVECSELTGLLATKTLRRHGSRLPIILMGENNTEADRMEALNVGANDFIAKPVAIDELIMRIDKLFEIQIIQEKPQPRALTALRKQAVWQERGIARQKLAAQNRLRVGKAQLDTQMQDFYWGTEHIALRQREAEILEILMRNPNEVVSKEMLLSKIWGEGGKNRKTRVVDIHIYRLRQQINRFGELIRTVRGRGYMFCVKI